MISPAVLAEESTSSADPSALSEINFVGDLVKILAREPDSPRYYDTLLRKDMLIRRRSRSTGYYFIAGEYALGEFSEFTFYKALITPRTHIFV